MKKTLFAVLLVCMLAACAPAVTSIPTAAFTLAQPTSSPMLEFTLIPATSTPTQITIPIITPDLTQLEKWKEYEDALGMVILKDIESVLCEWEILGQSDKEVYVWAVCMGTFLIGNINPNFPTSSIPAVIHLEENGAVQSVKIPGGGTDYASDIHKMFPFNVQERIFGRLINFQKLTEHLRWRQEHPEEPPLIILSATPMP